METLVVPLVDGFIQVAVGLLALLATVVLISLWMVYQNYCKAKHIPGVWQFLGDSPFYIPILSPYHYIGCEYWLSHYIKGRADKETNTFRVSTMFGNRIYVSDREMLKELHGKKLSLFPKYEATYEGLEIFGQNLVTAPESESWKKHHRVISPAFNSSNLKFMAEETSDVVDIITKYYWDPIIERDGGLMVDTTNLFTNLTLDVLARSVFGSGFSIFVPPDRENSESTIKGREMKQSVDKIFFVGVPINVIFKNSLMRHWIWKLLGLDVHRDRFLNKVQEIIALRKRELESGGGDGDESDSQSNDVVSLMIKENLVNKQLTEGEIYSNALVMFIAGTDTSSNTLSWFFYEVGRRPDIQKRIREEIDRILPNGKVPTIEDCNSLVYLNSCINETLRCHPPVGSVFKLASKTTHLGPILIPKDSIVHSFIASANKNDQVWTKAHIFDPERFLDEQYLSKVHSDYSMIPFSMGIRKCIGYKFSLIETCCILARMFQQYEIELLNNQDVDPVQLVGQFTFRPENMKIKVSKRRDLSL